ncbi:MAG: T9SS type A sorting domain-containing protein [Saprospiraceae bacterium]|nr:T9SS type A sorting domain-containing protein [Saprospiraceae bacterium]
MNIYPNPALAGARVQAQIQTESAGLLQISLLDESGKSVQDFGTHPLSVGEQQVAFELPAELPAGMYWVRAQLGAQIAVKGLVVAGKL